MEAKATGDMWVLCLIWSEDQHDVSYTHIKLYFHIRVHPTRTKNTFWLVQQRENRISGKGKIKYFL